MLHKVTEGRNITTTGYNNMTSGHSALGVENQPSHM